MRRITRVGSCLLILLTLLMVSTAAADPLQTLAALAQRPVQATIRVEVQSHMPIGAARTEQLDRLLGHMTLRVRGENSAERWAEAALLVDDVPAVTLTERTMGGRSTLYSSASGQAWSVQGDSAMAQLLDLSGQQIDLQLTGQELTLLDDADALLEAVLARDGGDMKRTNKKVTLTGYGVSAYTLSMTVPKGETDQWQQELTALCPDGWLCTLLQGLTFSGKQTMTLLCTDQSEVLRAAYSGRAGIDASHQREIDLTWKRTRSVDGAADELKLRAPSAKGKDKDSLTLTRRLSETEGAQHWVVDLSYTGVHGSDRQRLTLDCDVTLNSLVEAQRMTGVLHVSTEANDSETTWIFSPELLLNDETLALTGEIGVSRLTGGANEEAVVLHLNVSPLDDTDWVMSDQATTLDSLTEAQRAAAGETLMNDAAAALVRRLVLLPEEDALFLSEGIDPEIWETIKSAALRSVQ